MICLHSKEGQKLPTNHLKPGQRLGTDLSSQPKEGITPTNTLTFQFLLQNYKTIHSCCLSYLVSGALLWWSWETDTVANKRRRRLSSSPEQGTVSLDSLIDWTFCCTRNSHFISHNKHSEFKASWSNSEGDSFHAGPHQHSPYLPWIYLPLVLDCIYWFPWTSPRGW